MKCPDIPPIPLGDMHCTWNYGSQINTEQIKPYLDAGHTLIVQCKDIIAFKKFVGLDDDIIHNEMFEGYYKLKKR